MLIDQSILIMTAATTTPSPPLDVVTAAQAAALLGIKPATLYAYVSRGLLRSRDSPGSRLKRYARADVLRLKARADARKGHDAAARDALDWGAPVVESAITFIDGGGPWYRGLAPATFWTDDDDGDRFSRCAYWLARGTFWPDLLAARPDVEHPTKKGVWIRAPIPDDPDVVRIHDHAVAVARVIRRLSWAKPPSTPLHALDLVLTAWKLAGPTGVLDDDTEWSKAYAMLGHLCMSPVLLRAPRELRDFEARPGAGLRDALGLPLEAESLIDRMLIVIADHELNASTFAARVAASTGANLATCLSAALSALAGPRHGGACDRVEALLDEVSEPKRARNVVAGKLHRGEPVPGFGHRLYPGGDPRATALLEHPLVKASPAADVARAVADAWRELVGDNPLAKPSVDLGLVAASRALGLAPGMATAIFALGRTAGWIAHVLEQRRSSQMLRPRARYVGPAPERSPG